MSAEEDGHPNPLPQIPQDHSSETLTDLIDRMDREAFHRALEQRDLRMISSTVRESRSKQDVSAAVARDPA